MIRTAITTRDEEILSALARAVRFLSLAQITRTWWAETASGFANARRRLRKLQQSGLVESERVFAEELPSLQSPVLTWEPLQPTPDFGATAWQLKRRWGHGPKPIRVFFATRTVANHFGGRARGRLSHPNQATHDLGVAEMFLRFRERHPQQLDDWIGEDIFAPERKGQKLPDAVLKKDAAVYRVLEFGGAYDTERVGSFHRDNELRRLPYELW